PITTLPAAPNRHVTAGSEPVEDLDRGPLAGADGAVHVAVPVRGRLGAGPVDAAHRLAKPRAVGGVEPGRRDADRAAAGPELGRPRGLEVLVRRARPRAEPPRELVQDRAAALGAREPREGARGVAADEAEDDPRLPARRRVVHGEPDRALEVDHAPREAVVAPERPVVD